MDRAAMLANHFSAKLTVLHVITQGKLAVLGRLLNQQADDTLTRAEAATARALKLAIARIADKHAVHATATQATGNLADSILATAGEQHSDLLVLGAFGDNPVRGHFLGSGAERVIRKSPRPLLVVRREPTHAYRHVLVPIDFSVHSHNALSLACALAPRASITALHVFDAPLEAKFEFAGVPQADIEAYRQHGRRQAESALLELLDGLPEGDRQRVIPEVAVGYPSAVILDTARQLGADLIALGKHGRSPVEEWVLGSVTLHALHNATCDVLAATLQHGLSS